MEEVVEEEIQRLNRGKALRSPIKLAIVAEPLSQIDGATAFGILEELVAQAAVVDDPTAWVCEAAEAALDVPFSPDDEVADDDFREQALGVRRNLSHEELEASLGAPPAKVRRLSSVPAGQAPLTPGAPTPSLSSRGVRAIVERPSVSALSLRGPGARGGRISGGGPSQTATEACKGAAKGKGKLKGKLPANYKSEMCRNFARGHCAAGDACNWAHTDAELEAGKQRQLASLNRQLRNFRTSICQHWLAGKCSKGELCSFAHGEEELQGIDGAELPQTPPPAEVDEEALLPATPPSPPADEAEDAFEEEYAAAPQTPPTP